LKKVIVGVLIWLVFWTNGLNVEAGGSGYVVIDATNGRTLIGSNEHEQLPIASLTKIWTAIVVLENSDLTEQVYVSQKAATMEGSSIYLKQGTYYSIDFLLHGLMMQSGNDAATALAEHVGGSVEGFVQLMNDKAELHGLSKTHFTNPTGLPDPNHLSSAYDTAKMLQIAMQNESFRQIASTKKFQEGAFWRNKHRLLHEDVGAVAGKTGYTKIAGRTLATFFEREQKAFVVVTLNEGNDWNVHKDLANEIDSQYELVTLVEKGKHTKGKITIVVPEDIQSLVKKNTSETLRHIVKVSRHPNSKRAVWHVYANDQLLVTQLVEKK
jgi:serine-type D-Ala-D-Ala carboxypeptidase (penicillin-binding protein 5/6)